MLPAGPPRSRCSSPWDSGRGGRHRGRRTPPPTSDRPRWPCAPPPPPPCPCSGASARKRGGCARARAWDRARAPCGRRPRRRRRGPSRTGPPREPRARAGSSRAWPPHPRPSSSRRGRTPPVPARGQARRERPASATPRPLPWPRRGRPFRSRSRAPSRPRRRAPRTWSPGARSRPAPSPWRGRPPLRPGYRRAAAAGQGRGSPLRWGCPPRPCSGSSAPRRACPSSADPRPWPLPAPACCSGRAREWRERRARRKLSRVASWGAPSRGSIETADGIHHSIGSSGAHGWGPDEDPTRPACVLSFLPLRQPGCSGASFDVPVRPLPRKCAWNPQPVASRAVER
jgi:hypothetical protein